MWERKGTRDVGESLQNAPGDKDKESQAMLGQLRSGQDTPLPFIPGGTPFSDIIKDAMSKGLRQFFRRMPARLSDCDVLCKALHSLTVDVLAGRGVRDIMSDLRQGKSDWDPEERREIKGSKALARDSAFLLLYLILVNESALEPGSQNSVYNATEFVVSHSRIFMSKTRKMVRAAFEDRCRVSDKQRKNLDKWPIRLEVEREDVTTEEEGFHTNCFHSDSDWD